MKSMVEDIKKDTVEIISENGYAQKIKDGLDTLFLSLHYSKLTDSITQSLYSINYKYSRVIGVNFSDQTSSQLKNAGGMRLIRYQSIADGISSYWQSVQTIGFDEKFFNDKMNNVDEQGYKIFDRSYIRTYSFGVAGGMLQIEIDPAANLMTTDKNMILEYANRIFTVKTSLQNWYLPSLEKLKIKATDLIVLIKKEYHLE